MHCLGVSGSRILQKKIKIMKSHQYNVFQETGDSKLSIRTPQKYESDMYSINLLLKTFIVTEVNWGWENMTNQISLTSLQGQGSLDLICLYWALIGCFISLSGGLKTVGWLKEIMRGRKSAGITLWSPQRWLHHGNTAASSSSLSSSSICHRLPASTDVLLTGWCEVMFYLDFCSCSFVVFDLSSLSNLWLLTCSTQRLLMCSTVWSTKTMGHSVLVLFF